MDVAKTPASGRDAGGRFAAGNAGGPGRPRRDTERAYLAIMSEACSPEAWREIVQSAVTDAKAGDAKAREWLSGYLVGKPAHDATTLHELAVEEAAEADPVALGALQRRGADKQARLFAELSAL
jgi:hypothetical protein